MEAVKSVAGIALLVMGFYFLRPIVPAIRDASSAETWFLAAGLVLTLVGIGVGGVHLSFHDRALVKARKALGVSFAVVGMVAVVNWVLTPKLKVAWRYDRAVAVAEAKQLGKPAIIDFGGEFCPPCKQLEVEVFAQPDVNREIAERFVPVKYWLEGTDEDYDAQEEWDAEVLPTVIILNSDGTEAARFRGEPLPSAKAMLEALRAAK
jgi:thiol:disulfide interchange protein